jgi:hypothetical protein
MIRALGKSLAVTYSFYGSSLCCNLPHHGLPPCATSSIFISSIQVLIIRTPVDHWQDVLVGSLVGTLLSFFVYRLYYQPLESPISDRPYSPRIQREAEEEGLPIHTVCLSSFLSSLKIEYT